MNNKNSSVLGYLILGITGIFFISCLTSSCGKAVSTVPAGSNILYQVVNLSPDLLPVDLYINFNKVNTSGSFAYPNPSGYFALTLIDTPFQIRSSTLLASTTNIFSIDTILKNNVSYTLFITGQLASAGTPNAVSYILTRDTSALPTVGRGKIRFINASPGSGGLDITANNTLAFSNQAYKSVSKFIELPAGNYDFKIMPTGVIQTILADLPGVTVQDGKIYTLYSYGIVGRIDSAAFNEAVITTTIPSNP